MIRVGVVGATGKMGGEVCRAVVADPDLALVAAISRSAFGGTLADAIGLEGTDLVVEERLQAVLDAGAEVLVDFTAGAYAPEHVAWAIEHGVHVVEGTTGFAIDDAWRDAHTGVFVAPNFAIGAALMMRF
ncbi:MAG: 4-hydroxy-tetrahydrodipicolinate reductase, partial [Actinomycetota bacterium]